MRFEDSHLRWGTSRTPSPATQAPPAGSQGSPRRAPLLSAEPGPDLGRPARPPVPRSTARATPRTAATLPPPRNRTPSHSPAPPPPSEPAGAVASGRRGTCEARHPRGARYQGRGAGSGGRSPGARTDQPPGAHRAPPVSAGSPAPSEPRTPHARTSFPSAPRGAACWLPRRQGRALPASAGHTHRNSISHRASRRVLDVATDNGPGKGRFRASGSRASAVLPEPLGAEEQVAARPTAPGHGSGEGERAERPHRHLYAEAWPVAGGGRCGGAEAERTAAAGLERAGGRRARVFRAQVGPGRGVEGTWLVRFFNF